MTAPRGTFITGGAARDKIVHAGVVLPSGWSADEVTRAADMNDLKDHTSGYVNALSYIPAQYHAGIQIGSTSVDVDGWIRDAIAALPTQGATTTSGGGEVRLGHGKFNIAADLDLPEFVHLVGAGSTATQIQWTGATGSVVTLREQSSVRDLWIRGTPSAPVAGSFGIANVPSDFAPTPDLVISHWQIRRCRIAGFDVGVDVAATWAAEIIDNEITDNTTAHIRLARGGWETNAITIRGGDLNASAGAGVIVDANGSVVLHGVRIQNNARGVQIVGSVAGLVIRDCYFEVNTTAHVDQTAGSPVGTQVIGNFFVNASGTKAPYSLHAQGGAEWHVEGNAFAEANTTSAMRFEAGADRVTIGQNYHLPGAYFAPATDFLGTNLYQTGRDLRSGSLTFTGGPTVTISNATPETTQAASIGSLHLRTTGGGVPIAYMKESGTGNTGWRKIPSVVEASVTIDFGSIPANSGTFSDQVGVVVGAKAGDAVALGISGALPNTGGVMFTAAVLSDDNLRIYAHNITTGAIDPASQTFKVKAIR